MAIDLGPGMGEQQLFVWEPDTRKCTLDMNALATACAGDFMQQCLSFLASAQQQQEGAAQQEG